MSYPRFITCYVHQVRYGTTQNAGDGRSPPLPPISQAGPRHGLHLPAAGLRRSALVLLDGVLTANAGAKRRRGWGSINRINRGYQKGWLMAENPIRMDDFGDPYFRKPLISASKDLVNEERVVFWFGLALLHHGGMNSQYIWQFWWGKYCHDMPWTLSISPIS